MARVRKQPLWNFLDNLKGDKVVWSIFLMLMMLSVLFVFSSSWDQLRGSATLTRFDIAMDQFKIIGLSLVAVIIVYNIKDIEFFRKCSSWGFVISFVLLLALIFLGTEKNGATRYIIVAGKQIHVFEIVKIAMPMYIAWAIDALENKRETMVDKIAAKSEKLSWMLKLRWKQFFLLFLPFAICLVLVQKGSNSAAMLIGIITITTIAVGTGDVKLVGGIAAGAIIIVAFILTVYTISANRGDDPPKFNRAGTLIGRVISINDVQKYEMHPTQANLDKIRQPYSARLAIHQGGLLGKGPGQSTQRYKVPDISQDYMFSFIVEEYGILSLFVIALYLSLLARGTLIIKTCGNNIFAKCAIFGLVLLISGQAFLHILVNMNFGLLTGQTLPMLSHGSFAFLCFSIAFGIILSISRLANKNLEKMSKTAAPLMEQVTTAEEDSIKDTLSDLDNFEADEL